VSATVLLRSVWPQIEPEDYGARAGVGLRPAAVHNASQGSDRSGRMKLTLLATESTQGRRTRHSAR